MRRIFTKNKNSKKSRKEIEDEAFAEMRKAKAAIDPGVLAKVRKLIENTPMVEQIMGKKTSVEDTLNADVNLNEKAILAAKKAHANVRSGEAESVDKAKMLDIVAKMLELNPNNQGLKKGVKDILKGD